MTRMLSIVAATLVFGVSVSSAQAQAAENAATEPAARQSATQDIGPAGRERWLRHDGRSGVHLTRSKRNLVFKQNPINQAADTRKPVRVANAPNLLERLFD